MNSALLLAKSLDMVFDMKIKKRRTKCRTCDFYTRVKKGHWQEPDHKSGAGHCSHPNFLFCMFAYNITGGRNLYKPREEMIIQNPGGGAA